MVSSSPLVSVVCVAYQHAAFIERAVQSILSQRTNFSFELIIHDDASTDGTSDLVREMAEKHAGVIVPILQSENQYSKGNKPWTLCFPMAQGKYIALCEGDDHWVDPHKLQRQVDALERDDTGVACYTNAYNEVEGQREPYHGGTYAAPVSNRLSIADYLKGQAIPTCTFLFKRVKGLGFMEHFHLFATGDTALFTYLLTQGHFIYQPEFTGVRVMHPGGVYSLKGDMHALQVSLRNIAAQDTLTGGRYHDILVERRRRNLRRRYYRALRQGDMPMARLAWQYLRSDREAMQWSYLRLWKEGLRVHYPRLYRLLFGSSITASDQTA